VTRAEVEGRVAEIAAVGPADPEVGHSMEDALFIDVLRAIAQGAENGRELAAAALVAADLDFPRWAA
jgi:hypothetical protein